MMSAATLKWILFNSTQLDNWSAGSVWAGAAQKSSSCYKSPCTQDSAVSSPSLHWHYHGGGRGYYLYYVGRECPRHHHHQQTSTGRLLVSLNYLWTRSPLSEPSLATPIFTLPSLTSQLGSVNNLHSVYTNYLLILLSWTIENGS